MNTQLRVIKKRYALLILIQLLLLTACGLPKTSNVSEASRVEYPKSNASELPSLDYLELDTENIEEIIIIQSPWNFHVSITNQTIIAEIIQTINELKLVKQEDYVIMEGSAGVIQILYNGLTKDQIFSLDYRGFSDYFYTDESSDFPLDYFFDFVRETLPDTIELDAQSTTEINIRNSLLGEFHTNDRKEIDGIVQYINGLNLKKANLLNRESGRFGSIEFESKDDSYIFFELWENGVSRGDVLYSNESGEILFDYIWSFIGG